MMEDLLKKYEEFWAVLQLVSDFCFLINVFFYLDEVKVLTLIPTSYILIGDIRSRCIRLSSDPNVYNLLIYRLDQHDKVS
jgi:hypothetical protein